MMVSKPTVKARCSLHGTFDPMSHCKPCAEMEEA